LNLNVLFVNDLICLQILDSVAYITSSCFLRFEYEIRQGLPVTLGTVECSSAELQLSHCGHTRFNGRYGQDQFGVRCQTLTESKNC
jgi:hypothetical protein